MTIVSLNDICTDADKLRNKALELSTLIDIRHKLTANIAYNLYGDGDKEEGRKSLALRTTLDDLVFNATDKDITGGSTGGLDELKRAITFENLSEKVKIIEEINQNAKLVGIKVALINILANPDKFTRFSVSQQQHIKAGATGLAILANRRLKKAAASIQIEVQKAMI